MAITTTSAGVSVAAAAGSADPVILDYRLGWPNSASDGMVNHPIPLTAAIVTTFLSLSSCRSGSTIGTHLAWVSSNLCNTGLHQGSTVGQASAIATV